jgi:hypothetical protein
VEKAQTLKDSVDASVYQTAIGGAAIDYTKLGPPSRLEVAFGLYPIVALEKHVLVLNMTGKLV